MPEGTITRGTTNPNRLRRVDRWLQTWPGLKATEDPLVVDLGYGASAVTPLELMHRLRKARPDVQLVGLEIDPERVALARSELAEAKATGARSAEDMAQVSFERGGFEVPLPRNRRAVIIRAFNVLRQYDEADVAPAWNRMLTRLQPGGVLVDGTCDEIGRIASWIAVTPAGPDTSGGPQTLSIALRLDELEVPSIVAERLPKALIHRNVEGENIHRFLAELDRAWQVNAPLRDFGATQRWIATVTALRDAGWPIRASRTRWRLGELTVEWAAVAPIN
ncbi:MAG: class I SAM-dependent methyltransferase [Actinomycetales bacterium]|nr:class I SAM-dependent methyltransferase [Actinomycetales bacterium]